MPGQKVSEGKFDSIALSAIIGEVFANAGRTLLVLSVSDQESEKFFTFEADSVTLLSLGPRKQALLGDLLVKTMRISEDQLREALTIQRESKDYLGNILVSHGMTTEQEITHALIEQLFEELFDLITWDNAYYRFEKTDQPPKLDDPSLRMTRIEYNVHLLAVEVCEKLEHWEQIRFNLPHELSIYNRTNDIHPDRVDVPDNYSRRLLKVVDGMTPVSHLALRAGMSMFRTHICLDILTEFGQIRQLRSNEIRSISESLSPELLSTVEWNLDECADEIEHRENIAGTVGNLSNVFLNAHEKMTPEIQDTIKREDPGGAITVLLDGKHTVRHIISKTGISDNEVCRVLGRMLRSGLVRLALPRELMDSALELQVNGDIDEAIELLQWAHELAPEDPEILQELTVVTAAKGNRRLAAVYYRKIADIARSNLQNDLAVVALNRVCELSPESYEANKMLASVQIQRGEEFRDQAVLEFSQALAKLTLCGKLDQSRKVLDEILALVPNDSDLRAQLLDLSVKIGAGGGQLELRCPNCKTEVREADRECSSCGTALYNSCLTCNHEVRIGTFICDNCGKDPYSLPAKGQKGYTFRIKRAEGAAGVVRFKLFDALAKARKAASDKRYSSAIEKLKEAQKLQPYNEALKTEIDEIRRLAEEHEKAKGEAEEKAVATSYKKQFARRLVVLLVVVIAIVGISGLAFVLISDPQEDSQEFDTIRLRTRSAFNSTSALDVHSALVSYEEFLTAYPESEFQQPAQVAISQLRKRYEELADPSFKAVSPFMALFKDKKPEDAVKELSPDNLSNLEEMKSLANAFLDDYPQSTRAVDVRSFQRKISDVQKLLKSGASKDVAETTAKHRLEDIQAQAKASGLEKLIPDLKSLVGAFPDTAAAIQASNLMEEFRRDSEKATAEVAAIAKLVEEGRYAEAQTRAKAFAPVHPVEANTKRLEELTTAVGKMRFKFDELRGSIEKSWNSLNLDVNSYITRLEELASTYKGSGWEPELENLLTDIRNSIREAQNLKQSAIEQLKQNQYKDAFLLNRRLIEQYSRFVSLSDIEFRIELQTTPDGADVEEIKGVSSSRIGKTPCLVNIQYRDGKGSGVFVLKKRGFADKKVVVQAEQILRENNLSFVFELVSTYSDRWTLAQAVSVEPLLVTAKDGRKKIAYVEGTNLTFLDTLAGTAVHVPIVTPGADRPSPLDPSKGTLADTSYWRLKNPPQLVYLGGDSQPMTQFLSVAATDGRVYLVDIERMQSVRSYGLKYKYNIYGQPVLRQVPILLNRFYAFVAASNGRVYCIDPLLDTIRWEYNTGHLGRIQIHEGTNCLYVHLSSGKLIALDYGGDATTGQGVVLAESEADDVLVSGSFTYALANGSVQVISQQDGPLTSRSSHPLGLSIKARLVRGAEERVLVVDDSRGVLSAISKGALLWTRDFGIAFAGTPAELPYWIVVPLVDGKIAVLSTDTGAVFREITISPELVGSLQPTFGAGNLGLVFFTVGVKGEITAVDAKSSRTLWRNTDVKETVLKLFVVDRDLIVVTQTAIYRFEKVLKEDL